MFHSGDTAHILSLVQRIRVARGEARGDILVYFY